VPRLPTNGEHIDPMAKLTYKDAGVDLDQYAEAMARLPRWLARTHSPRVLPLEGGFAGLFQLDFANPLFARRYEEPVLVACTDGVGTKLKVASAAGVHDSVGIDLVAMCVNDAVCLGAEPLFFLDYVAMPKDDPVLLEQIVSGISEGCLQGDCALLGGETAILPEVYSPGEYDLAGFCVGVVDRQKMIDGKAIAAGDLILGLASSGLHSNGYSLARKIVFEAAGLDVHAMVETLGASAGDVLLEPTRIYAKPLRQVLSHYKVKAVVHGIAHITGGGLCDNLLRILPEGVEAVVERTAWPVPRVFGWLQKLGDVETEEMYRVFNMGIGMVLVVSPYYADSIQQQFRRLGLDCWQIGHVRGGQREVVWAHGGG